MSCIFCSIIEGTIPSDKVYEDELILAFRDIQPQAPAHILIIPKIHINSANDINAENSRYISRIFECAPQIASKLGLSGGYRIATNIGSDGAQSVHHLHFHLLGGRKLSETIG